MIDILLTAIIPLLTILLLLFSTKPNSKIISSQDENSFMNIHYTNALKGVSCIIVVMVHIPSEYGNSLQNVIGSFAYIGVTLFFLISGYGCMCGYSKNGNNSLKTFWPKRVVALFLPALFVNIINCIAQSIINKSIKWILLISVNKYIWAILIAYFLFFVVCLIPRLKISTKGWIISLLILIISLIVYFFNDIFPFWVVEPMGFAYGVILFCYRDKIASFLSKKWLSTAIFSFAFSVLLGILYIKFKNDSFLISYLLKLILGVSIIAFVLSSTYRLSFSKKPIQILGNISYCVYLSHLLIIPVLVNYISTEYSGLFILCVYLIAIIISLVITYSLKPLISFLNSFFENHLVKGTQKS